MKLSFADSAIKQLSKIDKQNRKRIVEKLEFYCDQNNPLDFAEPIKDSRFGHYRFRIGDYRAIVDAETNMILVHRIGHRRETYK